MQQNIFSKKNLKKSIHKLHPLNQFGFMVLLLISTLIIGYFVNNALQTEYKEKGLVLAAITTSDSVDVHGFIRLHLRFEVRPEKRIPPTGNWQTDVVFQLRNVGSLTPVYTGSVPTNNQGVGEVTIDIQNGNYDVAVKGLSHLRRIFRNKNLTQGSDIYLDLRTPVLLAGDSHPTADNYVNSLDISYEIINLYTSDIRADLNRDTKVNSLDLPTLIANLYRYGEN